MTLKPDIVRDILLFLEKELCYEDYDSKNPHIHNYYTEAQIATELVNVNQSYFADDVIYAVRQLYKAKYIESSKKPFTDARNNIIRLEITDITWSGHEFLNNVRSKTVWEATKEKASNLAVCLLPH